MEEILMLIIQFLLEVGLELLLNGVADLWPSSRESSSNSTSVMGYCAILFFVGLVLSGLSLLVVDHTFIAYSGLRVANLLLTPPLAGFISASRAKARAKANSNITPDGYFWIGFWFTLGLTLVRFAFAVRG